MHLVYLFTSLLLYICHSNILLLVGWFTTSKLACIVVKHKAGTVWCLSHAVDVDLSTSAIPYFLFNVQVQSIHDNNSDRPSHFRHQWKTDASLLFAIKYFEYTECREDQKQFHFQMFHSGMSTIRLLYQP